MEMMTRPTEREKGDSENGANETEETALRPDARPENKSEDSNDNEIKPIVADSFKNPKMTSYYSPVTDSSNNNRKRNMKPTTFGYVKPELQSRMQLKNMSGIERAKDRAQVTAATSMSIIHIALFKDLLDEGHAGHPYYNLSYGFILTALILQVFAGFISLYIALLRFYFSEYQDDFLDDCIKTCCPFRCKKRRPEHVHSISAWINSSVNDKTESMLRLKEEEKCCPFECIASRHADYEHEVLAVYGLMVEENIKADLQSANYDYEIKWLEDKNTELKTELDKLKNNTDENAPDIDDDVKIIKAELKRIKTKKFKLNERNKNAQEHLLQGPVIEKHVQKIQEERVLKKATFWQNCLNMMMYTVFILNALIAGFGLAHSPTVATGGGVNFNNSTG